MSLGSVLYRFGQATGIVKSTETYEVRQERRAEEKATKKAAEQARINALHAIYIENQMDLKKLSMICNTELSANYDGYLDGFRKAAAMVKKAEGPTINKLLEKGICVNFTATKEGIHSNKLIIVASDFNQNVIYPQEYLGDHEQDVLKVYCQGPL